MNVAIYCGSSFGNNKIYEEATKLLAVKLAKKGEYDKQNGRHLNAFFTDY